MIVFHKALTSGSTTEECACANVNNSKDLQFQIKNELQTNRMIFRKASTSIGSINDLKKPEEMAAIVFTFKTKIFTHLFGVVTFRKRQEKIRM